MLLENNVTKKKNQTEVWVKKPIIKYGNNANKRAYKHALVWAMLFTQTELYTVQKRKGVIAVPVNWRAVLADCPHRQAITAFLLQLKNVPVEMVLKGDSAHSHLYSKPESERAQRSYALSRDPKAFPSGVSFIDKGTHHSSLFLHA